MSKKVAIVGAGPAGCMTACSLNKNFEITIFDMSSPLKTLLPTGGGKCNLAHAEYNFKDLAKNYPRGEKFLYSAFSRFGTTETLEFFEKIGVETYTREDNRIFPISNSAKDVRDKILAQLHHCKFQKEKVLSIKPIENGYELKSDKATYLFDYIVVATGGKNGYELLHKIGHNFNKPYPSLVGLKTAPCHKELQGITVQNCIISFNKNKYYGNILFTDNGISGPAIFELSSINAKQAFPYTISIDFLPQEVDWQNLFNKNPQKHLSNLLSEFLPKSLINHMLHIYNISPEQKCCMVNSNTKVLVNKFIHDYKIDITGTRKDGEIVTCGGLLLDEFNPKTLESKHAKNIYACGEVLDIDGFCGGFNLQACWTTGDMVADSINSEI